MPDLAAFHPQIVHFVVGLLLAGVAFRIVSLTRWFPFTNQGATALLLTGAFAATAAVASGLDAHGPVERIPGARALVQEHEEDGETTRNIFLIVAAIEIAGLVFSRRANLRAARYARAASAAVGLAGCVFLYETAELGGRLVYSYGGGPGLRTGDPRDVERTYVAAAYNQAMLARQQGRGADAATLVDDIRRRLPDDLAVRLLHAESMLRDRKNYPAAMAALDSVTVPAGNSRDESQKAQLKASIYVAMGNRDSARAVLRSALSAQPQNFRIRARLDSLK